MDYLRPDQNHVEQSLAFELLNDLCLDGFEILLNGAFKNKDYISVLRLLPFVQPALSLDESLRPICLWRPFQSISYNALPEMPQTRYVFLALSRTDLD